MWSSKRSPGAALIRRLCTLGLPIEGVVPALMRALCRETDCETGLVLWFGAQGEIANLYAHDLPSPQDLAAWFAAPAGADAPPAGATQANLGIRRRRAIEICADGQPTGPSAGREGPEPLCAHRRLCGMAAPAGAGLQRLCCAIVRDGAPVASLILYRALGAPPFRGEERIAVKAAGRYLSLNAEAVPAATSAAMYRVGGETALLMCEPDGKVLKASGNAFALLAQASACPVNRSTVPDELERAGQGLIRRLLAQPPLPKRRDVRGPLRTVATINSWGLFRLRGFFEPDGPLGVLIERVDHLLVRLCEAMWQLDLSVQQGETLLLLAQGMNHDEISGRMGIAPSTVAYHVRQLYAKLGAHTRDEAIAQVFAAGETTVDL